MANSHQTIAILPPSVYIAAGKKTNAEALREQQNTESLNFQKEMYEWLLKRKMQGKISPDILDIETTNTKLRKAGYTETYFTPFEMCETLGVDCVLSSNFALSKPMSDGAAVALFVLVGESGATNEVRVSLNIHDCENKKHIWNYDNLFSDGIGSSPSRLVDQLMRQSSKRTPYTQ